MGNSDLTGFRRQEGEPPAPRLKQLHPLLAFIHSSHKCSWTLTMCQTLSWQRRAQSEEVTVQWEKDRKANRQDPPMDRVSQQWPAVGTYWRRDTMAGGSLNKGQHGVMEISPQNEPNVPFQFLHATREPLRAVSFLRVTLGILKHTDIRWNLIPQVQEEARRRSIPCQGHPLQ